MRGAMIVLTTLVLIGMTLPALADNHGDQEIRYNNMVVSGDHVIDCDNAYNAAGYDCLGGAIFNVTVEGKYSVEIDDALVQHDVSGLYRVFTGADPENQPPQNPYDPSEEPVEYVECQVDLRMTQPLPFHENHDLEPPGAMFQRCEYDPGPEGSTGVAVTKAFCAVSDIIGGWEHGEDGWEVNEDPSIDNDLEVGFTVAVFVDGPIFGTPALSPCGDDADGVHHHGLEGAVRLLMR